MTDTFTWQPHVENYAPTTTLLTRTAQFSDGYSQSVADGLNNVSTSYSLEFISTADVIAAIMAFIDAHGGYQSFYWAPLLRPQALFRCAGYTGPSKDGDAHTLTATFQQVFA